MIRYFSDNIFKTHTAACAMIIILVFFSFNLKGEPVSDSRITGAVEDELSGDLAVVSDLINVDTRGGIVTLTGTQSNILAKERAAGLAMELKGVKSVINLIKVDPPLPVSDDQLKKDIKTLLILDPATESYEVDVKADSGVVTLSGSVESWQDKMLCGKVAKGVYGVKNLYNTIEVTNPETRKDKDIRLEIKRKLAWNASIADGLIDVEVKNGKVTLKGTVGSASEKNLAAREAMVAGAKDFDFTELKVDKWVRDEKFRKFKVGNRSKIEIENAIKEAFRQDPRIRTLDIRPEVMNDRATVVLRGMADSLKAKRSAVQDARNTVGIVDVIDRIGMFSSGSSDDNKLKSDIYEALVKDPYVKEYDIIISALKGVVTLRGSVNNYFEKARVDDIASKIKGVVLIKNEIDVLNEFPYTYNPYLDDPYINDYVNNTGSYKKVLSDETIRRHIEQKLWWSPFVDSDDIEVTVDDGKARLKGEVNSYSEYSIAATKALEAGAVSVKNDLTVVE